MNQNGTIVRHLDAFRSQIHITILRNPDRNGKFKGLFLNLAPIASRRSSAIAEVGA